ncbi:LysR family transcriptional regulator [Achromobacter spanius]|uniref:LysR substrate-binding domain-containing protein n=1 Tax=Achromobacter spanius TaxID=217203 RepID=UPI000F8FAB9C|nr:LysR substrate-binding domain-containing protein [Achromobacter spanius]AZS78123.1 LysR family transcriptional regulator [Achromobacter spanius]
MSRMLPGTRALRTFEAAARHLNFTRAADEVGLTPAAVSYQIKEIEEQLDVVLFTRTSRSIQLTPAGRVLFDAAIDALDTLQRAVAKARRLSRGRTTQLRLSLGARFATHWFLPRLSEFRAAHPGLELTFDISDAVRDFEADDVDAAVRFGAGVYPGAISHRLFHTVVAPVCSPALLEAGPALTSPRDLFSRTLCYVDCKPGGIVWPNWPMWMAAAGIDDFDDSRSVAFTESSHVVQAVIDGGAVGLVEWELVERDVRAGRLVRLFDVGVRVAPEYAYHLVYPAGSDADPRVCALRDWMLEIVQAEHTEIAP